MKKARIVWISIGSALLLLIAIRVAAVKRAGGKSQEASAEVALIQAGRVNRADLAEKIALTGTVRPRNEVDVLPKVPGRIESISAQVGDRVKAGQLLAVIEHKEIAWQAKAAQAALKVAQANLEGAKLEQSRSLALFKGGSATQAQLDGSKMRLDLAEAQAAQAEAAAGLAAQQVENARITSPIDGTVIRRPVNLGNQVGPQSVLFTVQDVAALKLEVSVDSTAFTRLTRGTQAVVSVDALPAETFSGKVTLLSPSLDPQTRRASVELEIDNSSGKLLPNMFAHAEVIVGRLKGALVVSKGWVMEAPGGSLVYRVKGDRVEAVRPQLGASDGELTAVVSGLDEGDEVAASGLGNLADGTLVRISKANGVN